MERDAADCYGIEEEEKPEKRVKRRTRETAAMGEGGESRLGCLLQNLARM